MSLARWLNGSPSPAQPQSAKTGINWTGLEAKCWESEFSLECKCASWFTTKTFWLSAFSIGNNRKRINKIVIYLQNYPQKKFSDLQNKISKWSLEVAKEKRLIYNAWKTLDLWCMKTYKGRKNQTDNDISRVAFATENILMYPSK